MRLTHFLALILVAIVLAILIAPKIVGHSVSRYVPVVSEIATYKGLLNHFHLDCGRYPTTAEGLAALHKALPELKAKWGPTPYTDRTNFIDPWGHPYLYRSDGKRFTLTSLGVDGKPGGEGYDADIVDGSEP